jgi:hypothetical protein
VASTGPYGYLFVYFVGQDTADGEQVRFALSTTGDPLDWRPLRGGEPYVVSSVGSMGVRDPFLLRTAGPADTRPRFVLLGTDLRMYGDDDADGWQRAATAGSRSLLIWESDDLVEWSTARLADIAPPGAGNVWAPEATYDEETGDYLVYWASTFPNQGPPLGSHSRMICARTSDFRTFSTSEVWYDPGYPVIDATVVRAHGRYYRFTKDERDANSASGMGKFIAVHRCERLGSRHWELLAEGVGSGTDGGSRTGPIEGPIAIADPVGTGCYLLVDEFAGRGYIALRTEDMTSGPWWECPRLRLPDRARHGSVLELSAEEWERLDRHAG